MKQAAKQEARRLAEEAARKKAEEEAKRIAKEKRKAEEEAKQVTEAKVRANFEARCKAEAEVRAREKAVSVVMERSESGEKRKQSEKTVEVEMSPRGGEKWKQMKKAIADATSTEEIEAAMGGFLVAGPSSRPDPVVLILDHQLGEIVAAIDRNTRELAKLGRQVEGITWEMKRAADVKDLKGKGKAMPKESEEQEELDEMDGENEELGNEDRESESK